MNDIKKITFFMEECRRMGTTVLGPDINESTFKFAVNKNKEIRFGIGALKGVGEGAVEAIVNERKENGKYESIFDATKRINLRSANKKAFESLALAGGFDSFEGIHRAQYFHSVDGSAPFIEKAIKYGANHQESENSAQASLFGGESEVSIPEPEIPACEEWGTMEKLSKEKDVVGIYLSGHPLDDFKFEINSFCNAKIKDLQSLEIASKKGEMRMAGIVTGVQHRMTKTGKPFGILDFEGYEDSHSFFIFGDDYVKFKGYLNTGWFLFMKGKSQKRAWGDDLEFKISSIELLSELRDKLAKSVTLKMEYDSVNEEMVDWLKELGKEKLGKCTLSIALVDRKNKNTVQLKSREIKVNLTNSFIEEVEKWPNIEFKVN